MNKLLRKRMLIISISLAILLLINIGISYSYYLGKVIGNESNTTLSFKSAGIKVQYENNSGEISVGDIMPGWRATKNFSLSSNILETDFTNDQTKLWYEIILYVDQNDFPSDIITYTLTANETIVGNGVVAETRTNAGIATGVNAEGISIGVGYFTVGENKHDYSVTFNYVGNGSEYGNYPDSYFSVHIGAKVIISSVLNIDLDGGSIEGETTKYVSKGGTINLPIPIKDGYSFVGWEITSGDGVIDGNNVTVNDEVLNISVVWKMGSIIIIDLDGGTSTQDTICDINVGEVFNLVTPIKEYYTFIGWKLLSGNADISGNKIVAYDKEQIKVIAQWQYNIPTFKYLKSDGTEASYTLLKDTTINWRIKFLESGTLTFLTLGTAEDGIDVFLVGGGGGGKVWDNVYSGPAGGGGYTNMEKKYYAKIGIEYNIVVGEGGTGGKGSNTSASSNGGTTSAFGVVANGGLGIAGTGSSSAYAGSGGSGGAALTRVFPKYGGVDGGKGDNSSDFYGGSGQGTTTREFGESDGKLYASGGNCLTTGIGADGEPNTGNGGDGGGTVGGKGGSGIVIIRNARE